MSVSACVRAVGHLSTEPIWVQGLWWLRGLAQVSPVLSIATHQRGTVSHPRGRVQLGGGSRGGAVGEARLRRHAEWLGKRTPILLSWALGKDPFSGAKETAALLSGEAPSRAKREWGHLSEALPTQSCPTHRISGGFRLWSLMAMGHPHLPPFCRFLLVLNSLSHQPGPPVIFRPLSPDPKNLIPSLLEQSTPWALLPGPSLKVEGCLVSCFEASVISLQGEVLEAHPPSRATRPSPPPRAYPSCSLPPPHIPPWHKMLLLWFLACGPPPPSLPRPSHASVTH